MIKQSKADQQTIRDEAEATAREAERQFDQDLGESLDKQKAAHREAMHELELGILGRMFRRVRRLFGAKIA